MTRGYDIYRKTGETKKRGGGEKRGSGQVLIISTPDRDTTQLQPGNNRAQHTHTHGPKHANPEPAPQRLAVKEGTRGGGGGTLYACVCLLSIESREGGGKYGKQGGCKRGFLRGVERGRDQDRQTEREIDDLAEICDKGSNQSRLTQGTPRENRTKGF